MRGHNTTDPKSRASRIKHLERYANLKRWWPDCVLPDDSEQARPKSNGAAPEPGSMLQSALRYAALGRYVFPAPSDGSKKSYKSAKHSNGIPWGATRDPARIKRDFGKWPKANLGIVTGSMSGIWVLEIDTIAGHGVDGAASLAKLEQEHGKLPLTLMAESPSGSVHRYFKWPKGMVIKGSTSKIGEGIDIRADGNMVIAPPSVRPGKGQYKWINNHRIVDAPDWLIALCLETGNGHDNEPNPDLVAEDIDEVRKAVSFIPNPAELKHAGWKRIGMAIWAATAGSDAGFEIFDEFSRRWPNYDDETHAAGTHKAWAEITRSPPDRIGAGTLFHLANMNDPVWRGKGDEADEAGEADEADEAASPQTKQKVKAKQDIAPPVDLWAQSRTPKLPKDLLPPIIEKFAFVQGKLMGADPAGLAMGALTVCAAAIPDWIKLQPKKNDQSWMVSTRLWVGLVGSVSAMKTPIMNVVMHSVVKFDLELRRAYAEEKKRYDALSKEEREGKAAPTLKRIRVEDITIEAAQEVFKGNDDGLLLSRDEMSGWFGSMDKYAGHRGANADRAFWLQSYNGGPYAPDRVVRGSIYIKNLSISALGGIQPDAARRVFADGVDDGLLQRIINIMLRNRKLGSEGESISPAAEHYNDLVVRLYNPKQGAGFVVKFDDEAQRIRRELEKKHLELVEGFEIVNKKLAAHIGKYDGIFAQLCLLWHYIENHEKGWPWPTIVKGQTAQRVAKFLHEFLLPHAIAFYRNTFGLSDQHERLTAVAGLILAQQLKHLTNRDVQRGVRSMRNLDHRDMESIFDQLDALGWITKVPPRRFTDPPKWNVNPAVHDRFKKQRKLELDRRQQLRAMMAATAAQQRGSATEIARHPTGYVLSAHPEKLTPPWLALKLVRPGPVAKKLGESSRIWLEWNMDTQEFAPKARDRLNNEPDQIQDWITEALRGEWGDGWS